MKYLVYAPWAVDLKSGGQLALHKLADVLAAVKGESEVYIYTPAKAFDYKGTQIAGLEEAKAFVSRHNPVAIYPEVVEYNPFGANRVVRWILNTPGYSAGKGSTEHTWLATDLYFKFADYFSVEHTERVKGNLFVTEPFLDIFNDKKLQRNGKLCYLIRKGNNKKQVFHAEGDFQIDNLQGNFHELSKIFNEYSVFVCYDDHTFIAAQAAACGILTIVVPGHKTAEEWYEQLPMHKYGQAYGLEGIQHALETKHLLVEHMKNRMNQSYGLVRRFTETCEEIMS